MTVLKIEKLPHNKVLPEYKTEGAAGMDLCAAIEEPIELKPLERTLIPTGLKAYCAPDEFLMLVNRSSGPKKGLLMANSIGIIDHDYYENEGNDGHFYFQYFNCSDHEITIHKGDVIGQAIFQKYFTADNEQVENTKRTGGFGSTDNK